MDLQLGLVNFVNYFSLHSTRSELNFQNWNRIQGQIKMADAQPDLHPRGAVQPTVGVTLAAYIRLQDIQKSCAVREQKDLQKDGNISFTVLSMNFNNSINLILDQKKIDIRVLSEYSLEKQT
jgi:hypothetical protein